MEFDAAFERVIGHEGGYVNDPADRGGETKYGISRRAYPNEDIPAMTLDRARFLYQRDYWQPAGCNHVPEALRFDLFDAAVNSGVVAAIKMLQHSLDVAADGVIGPVTLARMQAMDGNALRLKFAGSRLTYMTNAPTWPAHGRGWVRRVASNMLEV